jgi:photosystem II stability/assembly factor-like uncharacterized protein
VFIIFIFSESIFPQWHWQNPNKKTTLFCELQFVNSSTGFACGQGGIMLKTTDAGVNWQSVTLPSDGMVLNLFFLNESKGWYIGFQENTLYKTTNGGESWNLVSSLSPRYVNKVWFLNDTIGFATGYYYLLRTTNGGLTWDEDQFCLMPGSLHFIDNNIGLIAARGAIQITPDGGQNWYRKPLPVIEFSAKSIYAISLRYVYVSGTISDSWGNRLNVLYKSSDRGDSWTMSVFDEPVTDIYFENPSSGWVCSGKIYKTSDGGETWSPTNNYASRFKWIGNQSWSSTLNTITYSADKWTTTVPLIESVFTGLLKDCSAKDSNIVFACGSEKTILGSFDQGKTWKSYYSGGSEDDYLNRIIFNENDIWAAGSDGIVLKSTDNGNSWRKQYLQASVLNDIIFMKDGTGFAAGSYSGKAAIYISEDKGDSWNILQTFKDIPMINKIKFSDNNIGWMTTYNSIMRSNTYGRTWEVVYDSIYIPMHIQVSGDTTWFTYLNKILRTTDYGSSWETFDIYDPGTVLSGSAIDFINASTGYASTSNSMVFKTTDGGMTWIEEIFPKGLMLYGISFVDDGSGWVTGSSGVILKRDPALSGTGSVDEKNYSFNLANNYPNPFNSYTKINYSIPVRSYVSIRIYDVTGAEIKELVREDKEPGEYSIRFDASALPSGIYFYKLSAGRIVQIKKMVHLK